ncbi:hypothetical protein QYZ87_03920 [Porphyromonadaceae bacterium W3.11]|nr:hypothetical protein [Porphyromonadaceae bacterium W3.11]
MKFTKIIIPFIIGLLLLTSCKGGFDEFMKDWVVAPPASIERNVKGHEQIFYVQAILRIAQMKEKDAQNPMERRYWAYNNSGEKKSPFPLYQEISFDKNDEGNMTITSNRKAFDIVKGEGLYYALELRYFDANNQLINHQFTGYYPDDDDIDNSTLAVHQHFFTVQNYALKQENEKKEPERGYILVYPMTLDSIYYDKYLFKGAPGQRELATLTSSTNIYAPVDNYTSNTLRYNHALAQRATEKTFTQGATDPYQVDGVTYRLYKTIDAFDLNDLIPEIFRYEYRDTDPIEGELGALMTGADDLGRTVERINVGNRVIRLRKERSLFPGADLDHMGFKGMLKFYQSNITFQMRVALCHIVTTKGSEGKYDMRANPGHVRNYNEINKSWNSFDIDYPIPFRVIADADGDKDLLIKDVQRFYPKAKAEDIMDMFGGNPEYFLQFPHITM